MSNAVSITEGNDGDRTTGDVCLRLDDIGGGLERDVSFLLSTKIGTAGKKMIKRARERERERERERDGEREREGEREGEREKGALLLEKNQEKVRGEREGRQE